MSVESERDSFLPDNLERCRRLVAAMRGTALTPSRKHQVLQQLVIVVAKRGEKQTIKRWSNDSMTSPRTRYLKDIQIARIKNIQKRWRRHMLQKRIMAKLMMEQNWRSRQGISRFRKSSVLIQRNFRGHFVRKNKIDIASYLAGLVSRLDRLRGDREAYHLKCEQIQQELQQVHMYIETLRETMSREEKAAEQFSNKAGTGGRNTVVHADVSEAVEYYKGEVAELENLTHHLEKELQELGEQEPVVHLAATLIQALYRGFRCRMTQTRARRRQQQIYTRMLQSKDLCYDRMHYAWTLRNQQLWDASARIIAGLYHVQQAKSERRHLRQDRAARRILRLYRNVQARTEAKLSLKWRKVKHQARGIAARKLRELLQLTWSGWFRFLQKEAQRRIIIAEREWTGIGRWRDAKAKLFLLRYHRRATERQYLERDVMHDLDNRVLNHIRTAIQTSDMEPSIQSAQAISSTFLLLIRKDIWAWQVPDQKLYFLAQRYVLPLDVLPVKQIHQWLVDEGPSFVDLYAPLPTQTLLVLKNLSQYFALHSRISMQLQRVCKVYEGHMLMREYLALMYAANVVRFSSSTTFSFQQRQRAVQILQEKDRVEYLPINTNTELDFSAEFVNHSSELVQRTAFTSFHCHWNKHLCEHCMAMKIDVRESSRQCRFCGRHQYEDNTFTSDLRIEAPEAALEKGPTDVADQMRGRTMWVATTERCDFMVLNAFLHVIAPVNHENRKTKSLSDLWRLATINARGPMEELYNRLPTGSLNDFLNASQEELESWTNAYCRQSIDAYLGLHITILKSEWTQLDAQLASEAQVATALFSPLKVCSFRTDEPLQSVIKTRPAKSLMQRKRSKLNERLKPLASVNSATL